MGIGSTYSHGVYSIYLHSNTHVVALFGCENVVCVCVLDATETSFMGIIMHTVYSFAAPRQSACTASQ